VIDEIVTKYLYSPLLSSSNVGTPEARGLEMGVINQEMLSELHWYRAQLSASQSLHSHELANAVSQFQIHLRAEKAASHEFTRIRGLLILEINHRQQHESDLTSELEAANDQLDSIIAVNQTLEKVIAELQVQWGDEIDRRVAAEEVLRVIFSSHSWRVSNFLRNLFGRST
jgi:hypothetical protein